MDDWWMFSDAAMSPHMPMCAFVHNRPLETKSAMRYRWILQSVVAVMEAVCA